MPVKYDCPICGSSTSQVRSLEALDAIDVNCHNCGPYRLSGSAEAVLARNHTYDRVVLARLSHQIRRATSSKSRLLVGSKELEEARDLSLPTVPDQANNLVLLLGTTENPGEAQTVDGDSRASIGCIDEAGVDLVVEWLRKEEIIEDLGPEGYRLTLPGWRKFEHLRASATESTQVFLAMGYGNQELAGLVASHLRAAVQETGLNLFRLDDRREAGSIDARLRVEIRRSLLLLADLTDANPGAYWEAGFAEGLSKPVIYLCERAVFEEDRGTHFDVRNHQHVIWDAGDGERAADDLKAAIRDTVPHHVIMDDR